MRILKHKFVLLHDYGYNAIFHGFHGRQHQPAGLITSNAQQEIVGACCTCMTSTRCIKTEVSP